MSIVPFNPASNANTGDSAESVRSLPCNIEAEQALLGALLLNNDAYDSVSALVAPEHFFEQLHGRIFQRIGRHIQKGHTITPITLKIEFADDAAIKEAGGAHQYLTQLTELAPSFFNVQDFARQIYDLSIRRQLIKLAEDIRDSAFNTVAEETIADHITTAEQRLYSLAEKGRYEGGFQDFTTSLTQAVHMAEAAFKRAGGLSGISSGLVDMDAKLGGFHKSDLIILAGRPSMGKTALATNIALNIARSCKIGPLPDESGEGAIDGGRVGFFSLEMSAEQLALRILADRSGISSEKLRRGNLDQHQFESFVEASRELEGLPLYIDDTGALPIATLIARARRLKRQHGLEIIFVDYLQLLRGSGRSGDNRVLEITEITQGLKALAKELNIPVIALSQLSRNVESREDKRPQLSDLRESGSIEQDADVVMFVFREEYYEARRSPREHTPEYAEWSARLAAVQGKAEVIIGKQRHGPIGIVDLQFQSEFTRFSNLAQTEKHEKFD